MNIGDAPFPKINPYPFSLFITHPYPDKSDVIGWYISFFYEMY